MKQICSSVPNLWLIKFGLVSLICDLLTSVLALKGKGEVVSTWVPSRVLTVILFYFLSKYSRYIIKELRIS